LLSSPSEDPDVEYVLVKVGCEHQGAPSPTDGALVEMRLLQVEEDCVSLLFEHYPLNSVGLACDRRPLNAAGPKKVEDVAAPLSAGAASPCPFQAPIPGDQRRNAIAAGECPSHGKRNAVANAHSLAKLARGQHGRKGQVIPLNDRVMMALEAERRLVHPAVRGMQAGVVRHSCGQGPAERSHKARYDVEDRLD
jgi:hypothetical protein